MEGATAEKVRDLRKRVLEGGEYTVDELRAAINSITGERMKELEPKEKKPRGKSGAKTVDLQDFLPS